MKNFALHLPESLEDALQLLPASFDDPARPRVLAGGQDLLGELKDYLVEPDDLVDLKRVPDLDGLSLDGTGARIGALVTVARLEEDAEVARRFPVLAEAAASVGSRQIRSQATLGGNLCQRPRCWYYRNEHTPCLKRGGDECFSYAGLNKYNAILGGGPSYIVHPSDLAPALVVLDATVHLRSPRGERSVPIGEFFTLPTEGDVTRENVLGSDEVVTGVSVPAQEGWRSTYLKFRERDTFDWALSAVALAVRFEGGRVAESRMCLGGVAPVPWRCRTVETLLSGKELTDEVVRAAAEESVRGAEPLEFNGYKIPLTRGLVEKALRALAQ